MPALVLLWFAGVALRTTILALPPVLPAISSELGLSAADIGLLAGLPSLSFALGSVPAAALIVRIGPVPTLISGLIVNAAGATARGFSQSAVELEAATALMCVGIAIMQPVLPVLVRTWAPARIGFATAVYTNGLLAGEVIPLLWTPEVELSFVGGGWRAALTVWALPVVATAVGFAAFGRVSALPSAPARSRVNWCDGRVWRAGLLLGGVNASYFGLNGFLPVWFSTTGWPGLVQHALIALNLAQIPASLLMLSFADRLVRRPLAYGVTSIVYVGSVLVVIITPGPVAVAATAVAGFVNAVLLTLALAIPSVLGDGEEVPQLSAAMLSVGYGFAVGMAVLAGRLWDGTGMVVLAILPFAATAALPGLLGLAVRSARPVSRSH